MAVPGWRVRGCAPSFFWFWAPAGYLKTPAPCQPLFFPLTGRLSRFSKIAGEMVPHGVVEEKLQALTGRDEQCLAVVGLPDEKKGERLVVLHTLDDGALDALKASLDDSGLPNLWRPASYHHIESIPVLGTGKVDLGSLRRHAAELVQ